MVYAIFEILYRKTEFFFLLFWSAFAQFKLWLLCVIHGEKKYQNGKCTKYKEWEKSEKNIETNLQSNITLVFFVNAFVAHWRAPLSLALLISIVLCAHWSTVSDLPLHRSLSLSLNRESSAQNEEKQRKHSVHCTKLHRNRSTQSEVNK